MAITENSCVTKITTKSNMTDSEMQLFSIIMHSVFAFMLNNSWFPILHTLQTCRIAIEFNKHVIDVL